MPQALGLAIAGFLFSLGAPLVLVNFFAVGIGGTLAFTALSIGGQMLLGGAQGGVKPSDGQQTVTQPVPARWKSYGRVRIAGPAWWYEPLADIMSIGLALNQGRIDAIETFHIDDNEVTIDGSGNVTSSPYSGKTTQLFYRLGLPVETAYPTILSDFGIADARGDGVATILGRFQNFANSEDQYQNYPNGRPNLRVTMRASVVWDPRAS